MKKIILAALLTTAPITAPAFSDDAAKADDMTLSAKGDVAKGKREYRKCQMCHTLTASPRHRMGPNLNDLFGSKVASKEGFRYSPAMKKVDFVWTEENLNKWLEKPKSFIPGNRMVFMGVRKEQSRYDLIAYLRSATTSKK